MNVNKKILVSGLVMALFSLSGCNDRAQTDSDAIKGYIYYADGVLYGVTKDKTPNENNNYNVYGVDGGKVGAIGTNHHVIGNDLQPVAPGACIGGEDAFDEDNFLVGSCTLSAKFAKDGVDGKDGADGKDGVDGKDGKTTLTTLTTLPKSSTYPNGAVEVTSGLDTNNNGTLDASEVTSTSIVLNGTDGTNGVDGGLITPPEFICEAGDTDPKCGTNNPDFKLGDIIFSEDHDASTVYDRGGLPTVDAVRGLTESIGWRVERTNGTELPEFTINNQWHDSTFTSGTASYSPVKKFRLLSRDGKLVLENEDGRNATVSIEESGLATIDKAGLTITFEKVKRQICFTAEVEACISYLPVWVAN